MDNGFRNASEINRRRFLSVGTRGIGGLAVGGLAIGGLTLADVLRPASQVRDHDFSEWWSFAPRHV